MNIVDLVKIKKILRFTNNLFYVCFNVWLESNYSLQNVVVLLYLVLCTKM